MLNMKPLVFLSFFAAIGACVGNSAQEQRQAIGKERQRSGASLYSLPPLSLLVVSADTDKDLSTSEEEFEIYTTRLFDEADGNKDKVITPIEYDRWAVSYLGSSELQPAFYTYDKNVDNSITSVEFAKASRIQFERLDKDRDGIVTRTELIIERQFRKSGQQGERQGGQRRQR